MADSTLFDSPRDDKEEWRPVPGWEDLYAASTFGGVKKISIRQRPECVLKQADVKGYPHVSLWRNGKEHPRYVHDIIAATFIGPKPEGYEVNHIDFDHWNNRPGNLEYGTRDHNRRHDVLHGRKIGVLAGKPNLAQRRLTDEQIAEIRSLHGTMRLADIADKFGISKGYVCGICRGRVERTKAMGALPAQLDLHERREGNPGADARKATSRLTSDQVQDIKQRCAMGDNQKAIAREYGVSHSLVNHIARGRMYA